MLRPFEYSLTNSHRFRNGDGTNEIRNRLSLLLTQINVVTGSFEVTSSYMMARSYKDKD